MKSFLAVSMTFASLALILSGCATTAPTDQSQMSDVQPIDAAAEKEAKALALSQTPLTADAASLSVHGMGCPLCASNLDIQLLRVKGVSSATIDLGAGTANLTFSGPSRPSPATLSHAVADAGFTLVRIDSKPAGGGK